MAPATTFAWVLALLLGLRVPDDGDVCRGASGVIFASLPALTAVAASAEAAQVGNVSSSQPSPFGAMGCVISRAVSTAPVASMAPTTTTS